MSREDFRFLIIVQRVYIFLNKGNFEGYPTPLLFCSPASRRLLRPLMFHDSNLRSRTVYKEMLKFTTLTELNRTSSSNLGIIGA